MSSAILNSADRKLSVRHHVSTLRHIRFLQLTLMPGSASSSICVASRKNCLQLSSPSSGYDRM